MLLGRRYGMSTAGAAEPLLQLTRGFVETRTPDWCCKVCSEPEPCDCADGGVFEGSWDANGRPVEAP